jgi:diguanylate cyclase (GGDEF)-like protein
LLLSILVKYFSLLNTEDFMNMPAASANGSPPFTLAGQAAGTNMDQQIQNGLTDCNMPATHRRSLHAIILTALLSISGISVLTLGGFLISVEFYSLQSQNLNQSQSQNLDQRQNQSEGSADRQWPVATHPILTNTEQQALTAKENKDRAHLRIVALATAIVLLMTIAGLLSMWIAKRINRQLQQFLIDIQTFALENKPIDTSKLDIQEFFQIAQTANRFASQQAQTLLELERLSQRDPLTDLFNRRHMSEILVLEEARVKRNKGCFGLIIADIDHFKHINDTYGHEAGDIILKSIAHLLKDTLRKHDQISRWGGEEFLIILPDASPVATLKVAEKLVAVTQNLCVNYKGRAIEPTITCGVTYHDGRLDLAESIDRADQALYEGKRGGRNCVVPKAPISYAMPATTMTATMAASA